MSLTHAAMLRLAAMLTLLLPLAAMGQSAAGADAQAQLLLRQPVVQSAGGVANSVPLWADDQGHLLSLQSSDNALDPNAGTAIPLATNPVRGANVARSGLQYVLAPNLSAHAEVSQQLLGRWPSRIVGSEVGATYQAGRYSLGVSVGANSTPDNYAPALPRVLPGTTAGIDGLSQFDSSEQLSARGRLSLGNSSGVILGASMGRIHLIPGNLLGADTLDQKALSFGVDHGDLTGTLIGRTLSPQAGVAGSTYADHRWNSIDLGVTWHLPWSGSLSVGAQNLWSSGTPANTPAGPEPDQSRTPYVQYHQDL